MDAKTEEQLRKLIREVVEEVLAKRAKAEGVTVEELVERLRAAGR